VFCKVGFLSCYGLGILPVSAVYDSIMRELLLSVVVCICVCRSRFSYFGIEILRLALVTRPWYRKSGGAIISGANFAVCYLFFVVLDLSWILNLGSWFLHLSFAFQFSDLFKIYPFAYKMWSTLSNYCQSLTFDFLALLCGELITP